MNNRNNTKTKSKIFKMDKCLFCWIFDGKGNHNQKHNETEYQKYIGKNYMTSYHNSKYHV